MSDQLSLISKSVMTYFVRKVWCLVYDQGWHNKTFQQQLLLSLPRASSNARQRMESTPSFAANRYMSGSGFPFFISASLPHTKHENLSNMSACFKRFLLKPADVRKWLVHRDMFGMKKFTISTTPGIFSTFSVSSPRFDSHL